jgi:beta-aspartyl-peptidase (threonine type)
MRESESGEGIGLVLLVALALGVFVALVAAGGAVVWQRQRAAVQAEAKLAAAAAAAADRQARAAAQQQAQARQAGADRPLPSSSNDREAIDTAIIAILRTQERAWNSGDIDAFMEHYWKSDNLTFSSSGKVTRSWQGTLENYRRRYPTRADMGTVAFENLEVTSLGPEAALVLGHWQLDRASEPLRGNFTLVFRRIDDRWVIIHDHTSRSEEE